MSKLSKYTKHLDLQDALLAAAMRDDGKQVMAILQQLHAEEHILFGDTKANRQRDYYLVRQVLRGAQKDGTY